MNECWINVFIDRKTGEHRMGFRWETEDGADEAVDLLRVIGSRLAYRLHITLKPVA